MLWELSGFFSKQMPECLADYKVEKRLVQKWEIGFKKDGSVEMVIAQVTFSVASAVMS